MRVRDLEDEDLEQRISEHLTKLGSFAVHSDTAPLQALNTEKLVRVLNKHADALVEAATASAKYASRLVWATTALVLATILLFAVALVDYVSQ